MLSFKSTVALALVSSLAKLAQATGVFLPLYFDPDDNCAAWTPLINSIKAYPSLPFLLVINPDNGPGSSAQPDSTYKSCLPKLMTSNVKIIGYVATGYGTRSVSDVEKDVAKYAAWTSTYRPSGIFFDEVEPTTKYASQYQTLATNVKSHSGFTTVMLNPGDTPKSTYYNFSDFICSAEYSYSDFSNSDLTISTSSPAAKQVVILHDAPVAPNAGLINQLATDKVAYIFITDLKDSGDPYGAFPTQWTTFVQDVAATL